MKTEIQIILDAFRDNPVLAPETLEAIRKNEELRQDMVYYFRKNKNRSFALALLDAFTSIRSRPYPDGDMDGESLMLACYLLGLHGHVEDALDIWRAKTVDFDTYCGLDIELIAFAGLAETIAFLESGTSVAATDALAYVIGCKHAGSFDQLEEYFSPEHMPWFV